MENKSKKMLLLWQTIFEAAPSYETTAYVINADSYMAVLARKSAGIYINSGDDVNEGDPMDDLHNRLHELKALKIDEPIVGPFESVVVCGEFLD